MTLVELMVAVVVMTVCISLLSNTIAATVAHTVAKRERALAVEAAQNVLEDMRQVAFSEIFARYNQDPDDDPDGRGTAPGANFAVEGLTRREEDPDGLAGCVILPADEPPLREDAEVELLGLPRDLNGDHRVDDADHSFDYIILPVRIHIEWKGRQGRRQFDLTTMFADLSHL